MLQFIEYTESRRLKNGKPLKMANCKCHCGKVVNVIYQNFKNFNTKSCGCLNTETKHKHGMINTGIYRSWSSMIQRCNNPKRENFKNYGGRGILVCKEWLVFLNFYNDMYENWEKGLTLERINVNGNYEKQNCTWITNSEQKKNKRKTTSAQLLQNLC